MDLNVLQLNSTFFKVVYCLLIILLIHYVFNFVKKLRKLPPGPWGLPFIGYLPFIREDSYLQMTELSKKYGSIFSIKCGQYDVIIINGWESIKQSLSNESLLGRPKNTFIPSVIKHHSLVEMSGEQWKQQRRIAISTLRDVGLGKSEMEQSIKEEIKSFIDLIKNSNGKEFDFTHNISLSISNNISSLLFGHKYGYDEPIALDLENLFIKVGDLFNYFNVPTFLPSIASLLLKLRLFNLDENNFLYQKFVKHVDSEIVKHQPITKGDPKDYIDGFLQEMEKRSKEKDTTFHLNTLQRNTAVFYIAGSDTIQNTTQWMMLYLAKYPEYQIKIRDEIKSTIGFERQPDNIDRQSMPITMAFIYETLRYSSIAALNLLRRATKETKINGFTIPKDSYVTLNFWSVHHDPNLWNNPEKFYPERFLNDDKSKAIKPSYLIPFSGGKRNCPGESLAYLQLFLYLVSILQQFKILAPPGKNISLERKQRLILKTKYPVKLIFQNLQ